MEDDLDVEALLEAPFMKESEAYDRNKEVAEEENSTRNSHGSHSREREGKSHKKKSSHSKTQSKSKRSRSGSKSRRSRSRSKGKKSPVRGGVDEHKKNNNVKERKHRSRSKSRRSRSRSKEAPKRQFNQNNFRRNNRSKSWDRRRNRKWKRSPSVKREDKRVPLHLTSAFVCSAPDRNPNLTSEERDMRTVFCMQLSQRVRARDLEEFFSSVGKVQDVRVIMDNKTRRSKGIAYVEFADVGSVSLGIGLTGQRLLGVPIIVQLTQAEKNRVAASANNLQRGDLGPTRLYVGSLHFNITEEMLKGIFEPFGKIDRIELIKDPETAKSKGYGFITFHDSESAKKALDQLNGFELAGRPMKVGNITDRTDISHGPSYFDTEEMDRAGIELGATGRLQLMAKLAEGTGFELPQAAVSALQLTSSASPAVLNPTVSSVSTQCFMLSNMFDPAKESSSNWDEEIRNDVIEECRNHGGALHVFVDKLSPGGHVYVKCPTAVAAAASVGVLHGRYFAGRIITAAYVPLVNYHTLFPDSAGAVVSL